MTESTEIQNSDPMAVLEQSIDHETLAVFRRAAFATMNSLETLREWVDSPGASGARRGVALWALGRHKDAITELSKDKANAAVAVCLSRSYVEVGKLDDAEKVLTLVKSDPAHAAAHMAVIDKRGDGEKLLAAVDKAASVLTPADAAYFRGRAYELLHQGEPAIKAYDEARKADPLHPGALFRLAVNVDLRGEDEEARELYEKALMNPPVNLACVINLGILYEDAGNYRRAMQCFDLALQCDPQNARARLFRRDASAALNMYYDEDQERREDKRNKILRTPINDFELSVRRILLRLSSRRS